MIDLSSNSVLEAIDFSEVGITDGLVAWYPLDGNTRDYTEYRNDATNYGATISSGLDQACYSFDGVDDYIKADRDDIKPTSGITVNAWALSYSPNDGNIHNIVDRHNAWEIQERADGFWRFYLYTAATSWQCAISSEIVPSNTWQMVTGTYDSITGKITILVDGIEKGSKTISPNPIGYTETTPFSIGSINTGGRYHNGLISDVRIYNHALFPEEIKILYELRKNKKTHFTHDNKVFIPGKFNEVY